MSIRDHAIFCWGLLRRWPRTTAAVLGGLAIFYFLYYAAVEALPIFDSMVAAAGMVLMAVVLKAAFLLVFYRYFHLGDFEGSFLLAAVFATVPLVLALALSFLFAGREGLAMPGTAAPFMLVFFGLSFALALGALARLSYWIAGGGLKRR